MAELTTQTVTPALPRAQNRVLKKFLANKSAVIGAVVGEFVGADRGLGFLINVGRGQFDTALVFVSLFTLILMAMSLYGLAMLAERRATRWRVADRG